VTAPKLSRAQRDYLAAAVRDAAEGRNPAFALVLAEQGFAPPGAGLVSLTELARALGVDKAQLVREMRRYPDFPRVGTGRHKRFDVEKVRAFRAARIKSRRDPDAPAAVTSPGVAQPPSAVPAGSVPPRPLSEDERRQVETLRDPARSRLEATEAAHRIARLKLARAYEDDTVTPRMLADLNEQAEQFRKAEATDVDLRRAHGELIELDQARETIGQACARFCEAGEDLERSLAREVEMWLGESRFRELQPEDRAREVRQRVREIFTEVRKFEARVAGLLVNGTAPEEPAP
jgi:hypothetical protein